MAQSAYNSPRCNYLISSLITFNVVLKQLVLFRMRVEFYNLQSFWGNKHAIALDHGEYYIHN